MPRGSAYPGPPEALERYIALVEAASGDCAVKGAKNPYTARNGHMFSFLDADGTMAVRLSEVLAEEFRAAYETGPVIQYGSVMRGYLSVPADLLARRDELVGWFDKAYDWIGTLPPAPSKKKQS